MVELPNELELNHAITRKMNHLLCVMKVLQKFKAIKTRKQAERRAASLGIESPESNSGKSTPTLGLSEKEQIEALVAQRRKFRKRDDSEGSPHFRDVGEQEPLFLGIGTGSRDDFAMDEASPNIVADSPTAVDYNVYDKAYKAAVEEQLKSNPDSKPTLYLTKFVREKDQLRGLGDLVDGHSPSI